MGTAYIDLAAPTKASAVNGGGNLGDLRRMANKSFLLTLKTRLALMGAQTNYKSVTIEESKGSDCLLAQLTVKELGDVLKLVELASDYTFSSFGVKPMAIDGRITYEQGALLLVARFDNSRIAYSQAEIGYEIIDPKLLLAPTQIGDIDPARPDPNPTYFEIRDTVRRMGSALGKDCSVLCDRGLNCYFISDGTWAAPIMDISSKGVIEAFSYLYDPHCRIGMEKAQERIRECEKSQRIASSPFDSLDADHGRTQDNVRDAKAPTNANIPNR